MFAGTLLAGTLLVVVAAIGAAPAAGHRAISHHSDPAGRPQTAAATIVAFGGAANVTWWAHPIRRVQLRRAPRRSARPLGRIHLFTEDGFPEVDLISAATRDRAGATWMRIEQPLKPAPIAGWVPSSALSSPTGVRTRLLIDRGRLRATLYRAGRVVWQAPIAVGKPSTPTPGGHLWIREKFIVAGDGLYGTRAFGTSGYSRFLTDWPKGGVIGIHGTDEPWLIPGRVSHGCIRVRNSDVERLYRLMPIGTPITVR